MSVADYAIALARAGLVFATDLWGIVVEATGLWPYYITVIIMLLLLRFLLVPIFGRAVTFSGSSDMSSRQISRSLQADRQYQDDIATMTAHGALDD